MTGARRPRIRANGLRTLRWCTSHERRRVLRLVGPRGQGGRSRGPRLIIAAPEIVRRPVSRDRPAGPGGHTPLNATPPTAGWWSSMSTAARRGGSRVRQTRPTHNSRISPPCSTCSTCSTRKPHAEKPWTMGAGHQIGADRSRLRGLRRTAVSACLHRRLAPAPCGRLAGERSHDGSDSNAGAALSARQRRALSTWRRSANSAGFSPP